MRLFLLLTFFVGVLMIVANELMQRPPVKVVTRYVTRDLDTFLRTMPGPSNLYGAMFLNDDIPTV